MSCLTDTSSKGTRHRITRIISTSRRHFDTASILLVQVLHRQVSSIKKFRVRKSNVPRDWFSPACFSRTEATEVEGCQGPNGKIGRFDKIVSSMIFCSQAKVPDSKPSEVGAANHEGATLSKQHMQHSQTICAICTRLYPRCSFDVFITRRNQVLVPARLLVDRSQAK